MSRGPRRFFEREVVLPGDMVGEGGLRPGVGTYVSKGKIYSSMIGIKRVRGKFVELVPLSGRYIPQKKDGVVGKIIDVGNSFWVVDINAPYVGILHVNDTNWKVGFGETGKYLTTGDMVICEVDRVETSKRVLMSMKPPGCKRLTGGIVISVHPTRLPRIIGKGGSMINMIKQHTRCTIYLGRNGRIWLDGPSSDRMSLAIRALRMIDDAAPTSGLTERVEAFLSSALEGQGEAGVRSPLSGGHDTR